MSLERIFQILEPRSDLPYLPLNHNSKQIRLLRVSRTSPELPICCSLLRYDIDKTTLPYVALSYTWGPPQPTRNIWIDKCLVPVRQNLWDFLDVARQQLRDTLIWIDQLCIDQNNVNEKNHQVPLMSLIYRKASSVIAWVGCATDDSNLAMDFLSQCPDHIESLKRENSNPSKVDGWPGSPKYSEAWTRTAVQRLFERPYWSRLWVVQEVNLAKKAVMICGERYLDWSIVQRFASMEHQYRHNRGHRLVAPHASTLLLAGNDPNYFDGEDFEGPPWSRCFGARVADWTNEYLFLLSRAVYLHCHFQCADPRDKIYGLLGLVARGRTTISQTILDIDYAKDVEEVFWDFVSLAFKGYTEVFALQEVHKDWRKLGLRLMKQMGIRSKKLEKDFLDFLANSGSKTCGTQESLGA